MGAPRKKYSKNIWITLTSLGYALLVFSRVDYFFFGISLLTHMLNTNYMEDRWMLEIAEGNFWAKTYSQRLDQDIIDVTFKGLTSIRTVESTLDVIQSFALVYADSLPLDNALLFISLFINVILSANIFLANPEEYEEEHAEQIKKKREL